MSRDVYVMTVIGSLYSEVTMSCVNNGQDFTLVVMVNNTTSGMMNTT